jgi:hypothetical protein
MEEALTDETGEPVDPGLYAILYASARRNDAAANARPR